MAQVVWEEDIADCGWKLIWHNHRIVISDFLNGVPWRARFGGFAMIFGAVAVPLVFITSFVEAEPFPREFVFGCYTSDNAPALLIKSDAIHIMEAQRRTFTYVVEPSKVSYQLNVRPALQLSPSPNGTYEFVETRGIGFFWSLLPANGKNRDRIRHPDEFAGRFDLYATDGSKFIYSRETPVAACR